ncbi:MAG: carboxypeptidase-like regulatory domain-containing protein [Bacteroidia bacterium]
MKHITLICCLLFAGATYAQHTLSGYVRDANSGEAITGAVIAIPALKTGTYTNRYGFYSLRIPDDSVWIQVAFPTYNQIQLALRLEADTSLNFQLQSREISLDEVLITDQRARENVERATMGRIDVNIEEVEMLPFIAGEKDLLKGIQLLPGVQSGSEASAGFFVRGGRADQNLVLMDEAIVYNPFHLAGYVSVFNTDAIRNVTLHKGSFPARFGGRLSSILEIDMKEGDQQKFHGEGGIGLVSSRLLFEGPIVKNKASFIVSGRRFYWDLLVRPFQRPGTKVGYFFHDFNAKLNYKISDKDRVYVSAYYGKDVLYQEYKMPGDTSRMAVDWGNTTVSARWNHLFGPKLFSNTTFVYSDYQYQIDQADSRNGLTLFSGITDLNGKLDFDYYPNPRHRIQFGVHYLDHTFTPSASRSYLERQDSTLTNNQVKRRVYEGAVYINDEITINEKLSLNLGVRAPIFWDDSVQYQAIEPRATFRLGLGRNQSLKGGYTRMNQFVHLASSSTISLPFDIWTPSSQLVKPQIADQIAIGYFHNFKEDRYEGSLELYYKRMQNQIDFKEGANFFFRDEIESELVFGKGWAYGAEMYLRKRAGRLTGWVSYTLSWSWRQFEDLNFGDKYPAKYDRRHDLSIVAVYKFNKHWTFSGAFVAGSGHWLTLPSGQVYVPNYGTANINNFQNFTAKNGYRLKPMHRLDLGLRYEKQKKRYRAAWHIDIYNAYNRRNPFFVYITDEYDERANARKIVARQMSLLPVIPSVSYVFSF